MLRFYTASMALGLAIGCTADPTELASPLMVPTAEAPLEAVAARTTTSSAKSKTGAAVDSGACRSGLAGYTAEGGWIGSDQVGWDGTGNPDPEEYKKISNSDMLARAMNKEDQRETRWGALVSIGRRKAPGAIEAFRLALKTDNTIQVREMAINGMMEHGGPEVLRLFEETLETSDAAWLRGKSVWGIAAYSAADAEKAVRRALGDDEPEVVGMALLASWSLKDQPEVLIPILERAAESEEKLIWQEAANVLSRMPYSDAAIVLENVARTTTGNKDKQGAFTHSYRSWRRAFPDICL